MKLGQQNQCPRDARVNRLELETILVLQWTVSGYSFDRGHMQVDLCVRNIYIIQYLP